MIETKREAKQKQFHEALLRQLYPEQPHPQEKEANPLSEPLETFDYQGEGNVGSDASGESDEEPKLTRSQRKRVKRRKLKEWASACAKAKFIGPRLPSNSLHLPPIQDPSSHPDEWLVEIEPTGKEETEGKEGEGLQIRAPHNKTKNRRIAKRRRASASTASS